MVLFFFEVTLVATTSSIGWNKLKARISGLAEQARKANRRFEESSGKRQNH